MLTRKVLQELQVSADDSTALVGSPKMSSQTGKVVKESSEISKVSKADKKEKAAIAKRSKRKNGEVENKLKKASKEVSKLVGSKNSKVKTKKNNEQITADETDSKSLSAVILNQSKIESFLCPNSTMQSNESTHLNIGNISVPKSVIEDVALITSDSPTQAYWKELAEQRLIALEKTLLENELLSDQVNVLQTENVLLKSALEAAEKVLQMEGLLD